MNLDDADFEQEWERFKNKVGTMEFFTWSSTNSTFTIISKEGLESLTSINKDVYEIFAELGLVVLSKKTTYKDFYKIKNQERYKP